jgi:hypothetical protein
MRLGEKAAWLAIACLVAYPFLLLLREEDRDVERKRTGWCIWLCIATIILMMFVPAIAAL